jgi:hypothetical protein
MTAVWNEKLITRARAADLCGTWPVKVDVQDHGTAYLRCLECDGNITLLTSAGTVVSVDGLIAAVLRHLCSSHDYNLSGAGHEN